MFFNRLVQWATRPIQLPTQSVLKYRPINQELAMSYEPDLTNLITELHEALYAATDPDKKELYAITLRLAKQVQHELASLEDKVSEALAKKQDI